MISAGVNAIIFSDNYQKVLIIKRRDVPVWVIPGGGIDDTETPEEAVVRECFEETGYKVSILRKIAVYRPLIRLAKTTHLFECQITSGSPKIGDETKDIGFFDINNLPKELYHIHKDMINDAILKNDKVMDKELTQVTYFKLLKYFLLHPIKITRFILSKLGYPINSKS